MNWPIVRFLREVATQRTVVDKVKGKKAKTRTVKERSSIKDGGQLITVVVIKDKPTAAIKGEDGFIHMIPVDDIQP